VRYSPGSSCRTNEFIYTERDLETVRHAQAEQLSVLEKQLQGYKQEATTKVDSLANENASLRRALAELLSAKERLREDNKVFRSAVMKLDTKRAESARAQQDAEREAQRLREQVRLLEQQNLTLLMQLQQPSCRIDNNRWDHNSDVF
jgi:chromosome segregation ATPase